MDGQTFKLPTEWVERIFERMQELYADAWSKLYGDEKRKDFYFSQWSTGLYGLRAEEIKHAITVLKGSNKIKTPPTPIEFYHIAKRLAYRQNPVEILPPVDANPEIANHYMGEIKTKLKRYM